MEILRYAAFSTDPAGGNPAGVVLDATGVNDAEMLRVAADIGYSETAFLVPRGDRRFEVRYRNAGRCSGLQAGGEGPRWEGG